MTLFASPLYSYDLAPTGARATCIEVSATAPGLHTQICPLHHCPSDRRQTPDGTSDVFGVELERDGAMNRERRHELEKNELAGHLEKVLRWFQPHLKWVAAVVLIVLVAIGANSFIAQQQASRLASAWDEFLLASTAMDRRRAMEDVSLVHGDLPAGIWALQSKADMDLQQGTQMIYENRSEAEKLLQDAIAGFEEVLTLARRQPFLAQRAQFGIALAYESMGELRRARETYDEIVKQAESTALGQMAKTRSERLAQNRIQAFYAWLADQEDVTPSPQMPEMPRSLGDLPDFPDLQLPPDFGDPDLTFPPTPDGEVPATPDDFPALPDLGDPGAVPPEPVPPEPVPPTTTPEESRDEPAVDEDSETEPQPTSDPEPASDDEPADPAADDAGADDAGADDAAETEESVAEPTDSETDSDAPQPEESTDEEVESEEPASENDDGDGEIDGDETER